MPHLTQELYGVLVVSRSFQPRVKAVETSGFSVEGMRNGNFFNQKMILSFRMASMYGTFKGILAAPPKATPPQE